MNNLKSHISRHTLTALLIALSALFPAVSTAQTDIAKSENCYIELNNGEEYNGTGDKPSSKLVGQFRDLFATGSSCFNSNDENNFKYGNDDDDDDKKTPIPYDKKHFCIKVDIKKGERFYFTMGRPTGADWIYAACYPTQLKIQYKTGSNNKWITWHDAYALNYESNSNFYKSYDFVRDYEDIVALRFERVDGGDDKRMQINQFQIYKNTVDYDFLPNYRNKNDGGSPAIANDVFDRVISAVKDNDPNTIWDSHADTPRKDKDNGHDLFRLILNENTCKPNDWVQVKIKFSNSKADGTRIDAVARYFYIANIKNDWTFTEIPKTYKLEKGDDGVVTGTLRFKLPDDYESRNGIYLACDRGGDYTYKDRSAYDAGKNENEMRDNYAMIISGIQVEKLPAPSYSGDTTIKLNQWRENYDHSYADFDYVHTHGWVEYGNTYTKNGKTFDIKGINVGDGGLITGNSWDDNFFWDKDGKFDSAKYATVRNGAKIPDKIRMPDFSYIGGQDGEKLDGANYDTKAGTKVEGERQRTYTVVHELTAFPGERIDLYPFSDIHLSKYYGDGEDRTHYEEFFIRWYDYQTDKKSDNLYFFRDPSFVAETNFGHFGGRHVYGDQARSAISVASFIAPANDFNECYIAADFSRQFDYRYKDRVDFENKFIVEPTIMYRHVFHITNAKAAADKLNGSKNVNGAYAKAHRRYLSARAADKFTIRLDHPMPDLESNVAEGKFGRSEFVYKGDAGNIAMSDGSKYGRIRSYAIRTYEMVNGRVAEDAKPVTYAKDGKETGIFEPYQRSSYTTMKSIVERSKIEEFQPNAMSGTEELVVTDKEGGRHPFNANWVSDNLKFFRAIKCEKENAVSGKKYLVQILGKNRNGQFMTSDGKVDETAYSENQAPADPLILQEYVVEFLDPVHASFMTDKDYQTLRANEGDERYHHTEDYLEQLGADTQVVNFDEYGELYKKGVFGADGNDFVAYRTENVYDVKSINLKNDEGKWARYDLSDDGSKVVIYNKNNNKNELWNFENEELGNNTGVEYTFPVINQIGRRLKLPLPFDMGNYGTAYNVEGDYNVYKIVDHSSFAPFRRAATLVNDADKNEQDKEYNIKQGGVYDRLFKNTNGEKRGYMYYVNAASDPGEIVSLPIDHLCSGTTIYVSAWVNEFTEGEPETANVIFNFRVKEKEYKKEGDKKIFQRVMKSATLKGFSSGYVKRTNDPEDTFAYVEGKFPDNPDRIIYGQDNRGEQGQWMHVYFSFIPDMSIFENLEADGDYKKTEDGYLYENEYELVLENNCVSSKGADYAIDDIRMYLLPPRVEAQQVKPVCDMSEKNQKVNVKVSMPFESLLKSTGYDEVTGDNNGKEVTMQYAVLYKDIYDKTLEEELSEQKEQGTSYTKDPYEEAFVKAVLHYPHRHILKDEKYDENMKKDLSWGTMIFNTNFEKNPKFEKDILEKPDDDQKFGEAKYEYVDGEKNLVFISTPVIDNLLIHQDFYIVIGNFESKGIFQTLGHGAEDNNATVYDTISKGNYDRVLASRFDLGDCARIASFHIMGPAQIIVDGFYQTDGNQITVCENQRPVVQVNLYAKNDKLDIYVPDSPLAQSPYIDWYCGSYEDFAKEMMPDKETSLYEVLQKFRGDYPTADTWDMPKTENYTEDMRDYLKGLCEENPVKVRLYQSSYVFPKTDLGKDENGIKKTETDVYVTAIPLSHKGDDINDQLYLCTSPTEVKIHVAQTSPSMFNGFNKNITYPAEMEDVPLRIGLDQLDNTSGNVTFDGESISEGSSEKLPSGKNYFNGDNETVLHMPLRGLKIATENVTNFKNRTNDPYIYMAETDDPEYRRLGEEAILMTAEESGTAYTQLPGTLDATTFVNSYGTGRKDGDHIGYTANDDIFKYEVLFKKAGRYKVTMKYRSGSESVPEIILCPSNQITTAKSVKVEKDENWDVANGKEPRTAEFYLIAQNPGPCDLTLRIVTAALDIHSFNFEWEEAVGYHPDFGMNVVGELVNVEAPVNGGVPMAKVKFYNNKIQFKEGYYYKFKFAFEEDYTGLTLGDSFTEPCNGETVFTVKVVPEYQMWTGDKSVNWNNDDNWRRVSSTDIKAGLDGKNTTPTADGKEKYLTDGTETDKDGKEIYVNANRKSYVPLNFTKVIVPDTVRFPQLAPRMFRDKDDATGASQVSVKNGHGDGEQSFYWTNLDGKAAAPNAWKLGEGNNKGEETSTEVGYYHPTKNIQYDMVSMVYSNAGDNVYCRPWYANAAQQIHFNTNAEILRQQDLDYQKAWVDMEMSPSRWYTVASPLQKTFAGDMYAPTKDARQNTELFKDITFDNTRVLNDRFKPAVYQRGWDKGDEKVYELPTTSLGPVRNVAVAANWSHVYNDVTEWYEPGTGYSVKTDVSRITDFPASETNNDGKFVPNSVVKFRFPKADESYLYQEDGDVPKGDKENGTKDKIGDERYGGTTDRKSVSKSHKLTEFNATDESGVYYTVNLKKAKSGKLFLVGNPFMSHLDMAKFLDANKDKIAGKYWIMTEDKQLSGVMDGNDYKNGTITNSDGKTENVKIAPMQGFFVEAKDAAQTLDLKFTADMMTVEPSIDEDGSSVVRKPIVTSAGRDMAPGTRGGDYGDMPEENIVRVSAGESSAVVRVSPAATADYDAAEDVLWIDDSNQRGAAHVYTVAGGKAALINQTPTLDGTEVGVAAPTDDTETLLCFDGEMLDGMRLLDASTGESEELTPGFVKRVTGSVSGRLFIVGSSDVKEVADDAIRIYADGEDVVVESPAICGTMTVRVYDTLGRVVATTRSDDSEIRVTVGRGVYLVEARGDEAGRKTAKLMM